MYVHELGGAFSFHPRLLDSDACDLSVPYAYSRVSYAYRELESENSKLVESHGQ